MLNTNLFGPEIFAASATIDRLEMLLYHLCGFQQPGHEQQEEDQAEQQRAVHHLLPVHNLCRCLSCALLLLLMTVCLCLCACDSLLSYHLPEKEAGRRVDRPLRSALPDNPVHEYSHVLERLLCGTNRVVAAAAVESAREEVRRVAWSLWPHTRWGASLSHHGEQGEDMYHARS